MENKEREKLYKRIIISISVVIPMVVAALFSVKIEGADFSYLPFYYSMINGTTAIVLLGALYAIKNNQRELHKKLVFVSLGLSVLFLVMYVLYHMTSEPTVYGGVGMMKTLYYILLISHIILSVAVIPLVLFTLLKAITGDFIGHRRLAKYAFPLWLYVAVSGVLVYMMISPYY